MQPFSSHAEGDGFPQHVRRPANRPDSAYAFPPPTPTAAGSYGGRRHSRSHTTPATLQLPTQSSPHQQTWSHQPHPQTALEQSFASIPHVYSAPSPVQSALLPFADAASFFEASYPRRGERPRRSVSHNPPTFLSFPTLTAAYIPNDRSSQPLDQGVVEQYTPLDPGLPVALLPPAAPVLVGGNASLVPFPHERLPGARDALEPRHALSPGEYALPVARTSESAPVHFGASASNAATAGTSEMYGSIYLSRSDSGESGSSDVSSAAPTASRRPANHVATRGEQAMEDENSRESAEQLDKVSRRTLLPVLRRTSSQLRTKADLPRPHCEQPRTSVPKTASVAQTQLANLPLIVESSVSDKSASPGRKRSRRARMAGVFHPPPQSMLRPGVIIPSAGAIAAPLGRGKGIFPGTSSSTRPSADDFAKMPLQKRKIRGRKPLVLADLGLTLEAVNDPYAPATDAQIAFAGLTRSGEPRKLQCCKVPGCEQVFKRSEHLKRHVRSIHTVEKREFEHV